jgi:tetratricopeptide (TPR) repeat protein
MRQIGIVILSLITWALYYSRGSTSDSSSIEAFLASGDSLYHLDDYTASAFYYAQAARLDSGNFYAFWKLGRSLNIAGELAPRDSQLAIFQRAEKAERQAVLLDGNSPDVHFQLARALGKIALFKGVFKSIGLAKQVKSESEKALALDSLHDGTWYILGRWNREIGKKPKLFRGPLGLGAANEKDAIAFMQKAISLNPDLINHHLEMGITYGRFDKEDLAREEFNKCLSLPGHGPLDNKYKEDAKKYLAEMSKK